MVYTCQQLKTQLSVPGVNVLESKYGLNKKGKKRSCFNWFIVYVHFIFMHLFYFPFIIKASDSSGDLYRATYTVFSFHKRSGVAPSRGIIRVRVCNLIYLFIRPFIYLFIVLYVHSYHSFMHQFIPFIHH